MTESSAQSAITDDYMRGMLQTARPVTILILRKGPKYDAAEAPAIRWEHVRRNFALRADGRLAIVCPVSDGSAVTGVGLYTTDVDETRAIVDDDPGVRAGVFVYDLYPSLGFPGDGLPR
jgi:hypothetical protein